MKKVSKKYLLIGGVAVFALVSLGSSQVRKNPIQVTSTSSVSNPATVQSPSLNPSSTIKAKNRSFSMGFTPWPSDLTLKAVNESYSFINNHGDMIAHHLDNGIPWQESLDGKEYSKHVKEQWAIRKSKTPSGHKVYLAITPLNFDRNGLAPYWGETDNMTLGEPWKSRRLNDQDVKTAYLNYAIRAIDYFGPSYVAIGIESNMIISKSPAKWNDYLELNRYVYQELKKKYPTLTVFNTIQYEHLRGIEEESKANTRLQISGVKQLMEHSDILALSTYHYGIAHNKAIPSYFDLAVSYKKPLAIAEMGAMSKDITIFGKKIKATEQDQAEFVRFILDNANKNNFLFVVNFVNTDYEKLLSKLPKQVREVSKAWVYTGLARPNGTAKPALGVWDAYLALPKR